MRRQLDYVCLQPTREGQASFAHVYEIVAGLRRRGWDVRLVEPRLPRPGRLDGLRRALAATTTQLAFFWRCRFRPAPFVYVRSHFLALPTALLARAAGSIVIQEVNGAPGDAYDAWPALRRLHRLVTFSGRAQLRLADGIIAVTPGLAEYVARYTSPPGGCHVIGNGADVERFKPIPRDTNTKMGRYVAFVGALASWQGIDVALAAVGSDAWPPGVGLVIVGDGRERDAVVAAASKDTRIRWLGTVPYAESAVIVARSVASLVPKAQGSSSRFGLSPLKLYEGMAAGVPVIVSDVGGLGDVVTAHECGIVVPAGDADALAAAVARLDADPASAAAMGTRGRAAAVAQYSWDARAGQTEQVITQVARATAPRRARRGDRATATKESEDDGLRRDR
ncbi:MAG TPA: glycosyltransferase family 4 protein [Candidatus Limnocylindrales bacterium]|nr:glycosyltransferase family 4 protein [Candidatus Limnocylindrales bacterium]